MGEGSSSRRRSRSPKAHRDRDKSHRHSSKRSSKHRKTEVDAEEDVWVEKAVGPRESVANAPTSASLDLTSSAPSSRQQPPILPTDAPAATTISRDSWTLGEPRDAGGNTSSAASLPHEQQLDAHALRDNGATFSVRAPTRRDLGLGAEDLTDGFGQGDVGNTTGANADYFGSLGSRREKAPRPDKPDPEKMSRNEINRGIYDASGRRLTDDAAMASSSAPAPVAGSPAPGSSGSSWRMAKLRRVYEAAAEEGRSVEDVGEERYGSMQAFEAALEERRILDDRDARRRAQIEGRPPLRGQEGGSFGKDEFGRDIRAATPTQSGAAQSPRYLYNQSSAVDASGSRPPSRQAFRRPGEQTPTPGNSRPSTPKAASTPVPSVFTPPVPVRAQSGLSRPPVTAPDEASGEVSGPPMSPTSLNRLQARVLKAKLMDAPDADELQAQYDAALRRSQHGDQGGSFLEQPGAAEDVQVLPTLDGQGRLYDVGTSTGPDPPEPSNGKKRRRKEAYVETRDSKTGELIRRNADDDTTTLAELVRQERFGGGAADQKNLDAELAGRIATDSAFRDDLDYMDDNVERLARKKLKTDAQKKLFAVNDFARTKRALETCPYCYQDTETTTIPPQVPMVALGTRTYLALTRNEPLVEGHCLIIPLQHHLSSLEGDDDTWEEIRNFMKCLMKMFAAREQGVIFLETVVDLRRQHHTAIECIPVPWDQFDDAPAYFREAIMASESEWSQHKKLIDFSSRPGGFRRAMVPNLPYFMCSWDYKSEKGYGHIIEGVDGPEGGGDGYEVEEAEKNGGTIGRTFGLEIIGSVLELESRKWRRPARIDVSTGPARVADFRDKLGFDAVDWTKMLANQA